MTWKSLTLLIARIQQAQESNDRKKDCRTIYSKYLCILLEVHVPVGFLELL